MDKNRITRFIFSGVGFVILIGLILLSSKAGKFGFVVLIGILMVLVLLPKELFKKKNKNNKKNFRLFK